MAGNATCWEAHADEADESALGLDYGAWAECSLGPVAGSLVLLALVGVFIYSLGLYADTALSPTLAIMCERLHIPPDVAGVTLLALGNGSPDVISSVASFTSVDNPMIGIGALLGAGMFVVTVVVGTVSMLSDAAVQPVALTRDVLFYLAALAALGTVLWHGSVTFATAAGFIVAYVVYVGVTAYMWWAAKRAAAAGFNALKPAAEQEDAEEGGLQLGVMSAFWHTPADLATQTRSHAGTPAGGFMPRPRTPPAAAYSFLIVDEDDGVDMSEGPSGVELAAGRPRGAGSQEFWHPVIDDYFPGARDGGEGSDMLNLTSTPRAPLITANRSRPASVLSGLYWQHKLWQNHLRRSVRDEEWWTKPLQDRVLDVCIYPLALLRDLTIPTLEEDSWSRLFATVQPAASGLFILFNTGMFNAPVGFVPAWVVTVVIGGLLGGVVYLTTHTSRPPRGLLYSAVWALWSFVMCLAWIYLLASEMVLVLEALGSLWGISPSVLALTVLAWGNSVGDMFTNVSVAKSGLADMAVAGCYGGPTFNLLVGLGLSFGWACAASSEAYELKPDAHAIVSLVFLLVVLLGSYVYAYMRNFTLDRGLGVALVCVYFVYTAVQLAVLFAESR